MTKSEPTSATSPINPRMLRIAMVAKYLSATNWFVEELIRSGSLPSMMFGKHYVVDLNDVNAWIEQQKLIHKMRSDFHIITSDEEAQAFFAGAKQDEDGNYISNPDSE